MARMIPPIVHPGCQSPGEREIFYRLKADPETANWIVLHSLDIANHIKNISGEADFVVIVPHKGVLCIEVKACSHLKREEGLWYYGTDNQPDARGPFKQSADAMHSLRKKLREKKPELSHISFWSAVIFPYIEFSIFSDEWQPWQIIDVRSYRCKSIGYLINQILSKAREFLAKRQIPWFDPFTEDPSPKQCQNIATILRPDFEFFESPKSRALGLEEELKRYTDEQFEALDTMEINQRVIFAGPAGTGKTLLALETARREIAKGKHVLLICFNRLLGKWLAAQTSNLKPILETDTLHSHMLDVSGDKINESILGNEFWETGLPLLAMERLGASPEKAHIFDVIIIDEAQDILTDNYLDFLDMSLVGGLASGRWRMFGDFENQSIYSLKGNLPQDIINKRCKDVPIFSLRTNCRNTPRVAEITHLLGGLLPPYKKILRPDDKVNPELYYYTDAVSQQNLLLKCADKLYAEGYMNKDIVILSMHGEATSLAANMAIDALKSKLSPFSLLKSNTIGYCTIHLFKGLESPAIIISDVDKVGDKLSTSLLYVGITRCLSRLFILADDCVKKQIAEILMNSK